MAQDPVAKALESEVAHGIDDAIDALRWARRNQLQHQTPETLRLVQHNLGILALAADWHMGGEDLKAQELLGRLWWSPQKRPSGPLDMNPTGH